MADPQVQIGGSQPIDEGDVEMEGGNDGAEVIEVGESGAAGGAAEEEEKPAQRATFVEYAVLPPLIANAIRISNSMLTLPQLPQIPHGRAPHRQRRSSNPPDSA